MGEKMREIIPTQLYQETFPRDFFRLGRCKHCGGKIKLKVKPKYYILKGLMANGCIFVKKSTIKTAFWVAVSFFTYKNGMMIYALPPETKSKEEK